MKATAIAPVSNDAAPDIVLGRPYLVNVKISGVCAILFHRWSVEAVEEKAKGKKGSAIKKTDNVESYVMRCENGRIGLPGEYLRQAIINAAKYRQDPRSPRKSAMDLFEAGLICLTEAADLGSDKWDYLDRRRVVVQRAGITRERPAFRKGWKAEFEFQVIAPEYIDDVLLRECLNDAGRLVGVGDFRPTFGRFGVDGFNVQSLS